MTAFGRVIRKEDARFIRGQGRFLDDVQLPGMLHGAILRSPFAHAEIVALEGTEALPGVSLIGRAVVPDDPFPVRMALAL